METREIKRINVLSAAKIVGLLYTAFGLIAWLFFACGGLLQLTGLTFLIEEDTLGAFGAGAGGIIIVLVVLLCVFPLMYGVIGAIAGAIGAALYNLIAGWFGGLEVQVGLPGK